MAERLFPAPPADKGALEEGRVLTPRFDQNGLVPAVATDVGTGDLLMLAYMNAEALGETLRTGIVHYWSRSRGALWRKGDTSGQIQTVKEIRIDCDQDAIWLKVEVGGDGGCCHTGRRACFYRRVEESADGWTLVMDADD
ncbi:MAG: phosphoribosyl-AMP cyclohydrolase [Pseudomonadota bacterium]